MKGKSRGSEGLEKYFELVRTKSLEEAKEYLDGHKQVKQEYLEVVDQYMHGDGSERLKLGRQYPELTPSFEKIDEEAKGTDLIVDWIRWLRRNRRPL